MTPARLAVGIAILASALGAEAGPAETHAAPTPVRTDLQARIDAARPGDVLDLGSATWAGPVRIDKRVVLRGGTVDGGGRGDAIVITAAGAVLDGVTVRHSGSDLSGPDACVWIEKTATGAEVRGSTLSECAFGIWVNVAHEVRLVDNRVIGSLVGNRSDRGNGIQLFDSTHLVVEGNVVTGGRDGIYVSATQDSVIRRNRIRDTRYGVHYMFSYSNRVEDNEADDNDGGFALMESRGITATGNVARNNSGHGMLFRDAQYCTIARNRLEHNGEGLFFFSSTENRITDNDVVGNDVGAKVWAGSKRNVVSHNVFADNRVQVFYVGTHDLAWGGGAGGQGNFWSDYVGWDQNGDGVGDRPYRVDSFTTHVIRRYPAATLLMRSPALELLARLEESLPVLRVPTVVDERPLVRRDP
jgi:nitrous oxidase accessory protein